MHIRVRTKVFQFSRAAIAFMLLSAASVAQTPTQQQLDALKNLPQDQQSAIMQSVLGNGSGAANGANKADPRLNSPQTVQPKSPLDMLEQGKTIDGRRLRQANEDTELQADDNVLLELTPVEETDCSTASLNGNGTTSAAGTAPGINGAPVNLGANNNANQNAALASLGAANGNGANNTDSSKLSLAALKYRCQQLAQAKPKTDQEKEQAETFRKRILASNPYKLTRNSARRFDGDRSDGSAERRPGSQ